MTRRSSGATSAASRPVRRRDPTHEERPAGDSAEANDEISPHDLPKGHPGRAEAERNAADSETGTTSGNR